MTKLEPDDWWLPVIEIVEYDIDSITKCLRLKTDDPIPAFRECYKLAEHLQQIIKIAAIRQERDHVGFPFIQVLPPDD